MTMDFTTHSVTLMSTMVQLAVNFTTIKYKGSLCYKISIQLLYLNIADGNLLFVDNPVHV